MNYRESYGLFACNGLLFNHESPLRAKRFVTRKIIAAACAIKQGSTERLRLGNLDICRDWGSAMEYVDAMWRMMQLEAPDDFVIATGETHSLREFVAAAFAEVGLDWSDHVDIDPILHRPLDIAYSAGNAGKAAETLGWRAETKMSGIIRMMIAAEVGQPWPGEPVAAV